MGLIRLSVKVGGGAYPVVVGPGALGELAGVVPAAARRVAVVTQPGIGVTVDPGREHEVFAVGDGEAAKTLATVEDLCRAWSRWGLTRGDAVVAVGGGVVTDTAGFAAAVYHRGVAVVQVPTTLLGMVDAAIGGKTGVNLPEGKNLVGAFRQPRAVVCDTETLATLPARERRSGDGEMAKYHFLTGDDLAALPIDERVAACVRIKAAVVAADEREAPDDRRGRARLNYGHTLAHALETAGRYGLRHGEAVAVGLVYAAELARHLGRIGDARVADHRRVVAGYGLDAALPAGTDPAELVALMGRDKKAIDGLTFVLDGPDGVEVVAGVAPDDALAALARMDRHTASAPRLPAGTSPAPGATGTAEAPSAAGAASAPGAPGAASASSAAGASPASDAGAAGPGPAGDAGRPA
ncbi:MAG TPA: 3-dehydroquinate synthase family protein [Acidimicrobiales bacterium]|nr:3-dehydroquinate synthase family protein [Acidimicrobiales bacterium]